LTFLFKELLFWYTDPASHKEVARIEKEALAHFRSYYDGHSATTYQNWTRDEPLKSSYPDSEKLERLKALKRHWDPEGVFTRIFL
jgi:FAD/FMN-containing dehydrogenase